MTGPFRTSRDAADLAALAARDQRRARLFALCALGLLGLLGWGAWSGRLPCASGPCREVMADKGLGMLLDAALGSLPGGLLAGVSVSLAGLAVLHAMAYTRRTGRIFWY
ncbi:hypothetical protein [Caenispirillum bisanense]|uniref:hypothetical protein n=1 Tax=Caenispirillum bisanense TaxID=414052 RepID=UPI0031DEE2D0